MAEALRVLNFADGGLDQLQSTSGTVSAVTTPTPNTATYCLSIAAGARAQFETGTEHPASTATSPTKSTFLIRFTDVSPAAAIDFWVERKGGGITDAYRNIVLRLRTDGDVEVRSADNATVDATITAPFTVNTWHYVSVWYQNSATGNAEVVIDGSSTTTSSKDYDATSGTGLGEPFCDNDASSSTTVYLSEVTLWSAVTNNSDIADHFDVYDFRPDGTPTTAFDNIDIDSYTAGDVGDQPFNTSTAASYTSNPTGTAKWAVDFDSTGGGPSTASVTGTIAAGSWFYAASRGGGSGSGNVKELLFGSSGDAVTALTSVSYNPGTGTGYYWATEDSLTILPTTSEDAAAGIAQDGARGHDLEDVCFMLAVEANISSDVNVDAGPETLAINTQQATVGVLYNIDAGPETLQINTQQATITQAVDIDAGPETLQINTQQATVGVVYDIDAGPETLQINTFQATVTAGTNIDAGPETLQINTQAATIALDYDIDAGPETLQINTQAATVGVSYDIDAGPETLQINTQQATVGLDINIDAGPETLQINTFAATITTGEEIVAGPETLQINTQAATVGVVYDIDAGPETLQINTQAATVGLDINVDAGPETLQINTHQATIDVTSGAVNIDAGPETLQINTLPATITAEADNVVTASGTSWNPDWEDYYNRQLGVQRPKPQPDEIKEAIREVYRFEPDPDNPPSFLGRTKRTIETIDAKGHLLDGLQHDMDATIQILAAAEALAAYKRRRRDDDDAVAILLLTAWP